MAQCPKCEEKLPLLSKICPVCGYTIESDESSTSAAEMINSLEVCLYKFKEIPKPSFMRGLGQLTIFTYPLIAVYMMILAVMSSAGLFWIISFIFWILAVKSILQKVKGKLGNDAFNKEFESLKNQYEFLEREVRRNYGKDREVSRLVTSITDEILKINRERTISSRRNLLAWVIIVALFFISGGGAGVYSVSKALTPSVVVTSENFENVISDIGWERAVEFFSEHSSEYNDVEVKNLLSKITPLALEGGSASVVEELFLEQCMGKIGDKDVAKIIVTYHIKQGDITAAQDFIDRCDNLRYSSDRGELESLIK